MLKFKEGMQIGMFDQVCEKCRSFKINNELHTIDCINEDIDQRNYFKYLGEGEKGYPYFKERIDTIGC